MTAVLGLLLMASLATGSLAGTVTMIVAMTTLGHTQPAWVFWVKTWGYLQATVIPLVLMVSLPWGDL